MKYVGIVAWGLMIARLAMGAPGAGGKAAVPAKPPTVEATYPGLASGGLTHALLGRPPEGTILKAGNLALTEKDLAMEIAKAPAEVQDQLRKNAFYMLEQLATGKLLLQAAKARAGVPAGGDREVIQAHLMAIVAEAKVSDKEIGDFYRDNQGMLGGATLDKVRPQIEQFLLQQKQQEMVLEHVRTLGKRTEIVVSAAWVKEAAALARDNPVDKARASGKPSMVDFGADCRACDMMVPILANLKEKHAGKLNVLFVHVRKEQVLAARYGIQSIPVQVFFDKEGKEAFRHVGFFAQEEIATKLAELGVK